WVLGDVPARGGATEVIVTVENQIHYCAAVKAEAFARNGLTVQGQIVITPRDNRPHWRAIAQHSTPLNIIVDVINKKSQNHYAEQLLKMIGAEKKGEGSWKEGAAAVTEWLTGKLGVPPDEYHQADGSGMSRENRASANAFIHLLREMWKSPWREDFVSSLPYSGDRSEEHTSELQSQSNLVCRLLLEKKKRIR